MLLFSTVLDIRKSLTKEKFIRLVLEWNRENPYTENIIAVRYEKVSQGGAIWDALRKELQAFGFEITEDGKHYKLTYFGDDRYVVTVSKTPSDWRTGKNTVIKIVEKVL